jgi:hypothetical protein
MYLCFCEGAFAFFIHFVSNSLSPGRTLAELFPAASGETELEPIGEGDEAPRGRRVHPPRRMHAGGGDLVGRRGAARAWHPCPRQMGEAPRGRGVRPSALCGGGGVKVFGSLDGFAATGGRSGGWLASPARRGKGSSGRGI